MARFIFYAVVAWLVFRWLDMLFSPSKSRRRSTPPPPRRPNQGGSAKSSQTKKPNSDKIGDYVDFEEVEE